MSEPRAQATVDSVPPSTVNPIPQATVNPIPQAAVNTFPQPTAEPGQPATLEPSPKPDQVHETLVEEDLLVEDVSIDGMCGVY